MGSLYTAPTLAQARADVAAALTQIDGVTVVARRASEVPEPGHGWVVVREVTPAPRYGTKVARLAAVITLGADEEAAEDLLDALMSQCVSAVRHLGGSISVTPMSLPVETVQLYALEVSISVEME